MVQKKKLKKIHEFRIILSIGVPSHIYGILTIQKHDIIFGEAEIGVPISELNFSYKMHVKKHVPNIVPIIFHILTSLICLLVTTFLMSHSCMYL